MMIDVLALMIEQSPDQMGSVNMISQTLGAGGGYHRFEDVINHY